MAGKKNDRVMQITLGREGGSNQEVGRRDKQKSREGKGGERDDEERREGRVGRRRRGEEREKRMT